MTIDRDGAIRRGRELGWADLSRIDNEEYFIGREHAEWFHEWKLKTVTRQKVVRAFGNIVLPSHRGELIPVEGIPEEFRPIVAERTEIGFPGDFSKYAEGLTREKANKVVQVGSFITFLAWWTPDKFELPDLSAEQEFIVRHLAAQLKRQIDETTA